MDHPLHPDRGQKGNRALFFVLAILMFGIAFSVLQHRQATATATGISSDLPVLKYSWHTFLGSSTSIDGGLNLGTDPDGNIYLVGISTEEWLGPSGQEPLHAAGGSNIVIVKLDKHGTYQWHTYYGSPSSNGVWGIAVDGNGDVYITGYSMESWDGPQSQPPLHAFDGFWNLFVLKLNKDGAYQWHTFYGNSVDVGNGIALDGKGGIYIAGKSYTSWLGDGNAAPLYPFFFNPLENYNMLVLKLNTAGAYQWHAFFGAGETDIAWEVEADSAGGIYVAGTSGDWKLDSGPSPKHQHSGDSDIMVLKLNEDGAYQWHTFYGNEGGDEGLDLSVDDRRNVYLSGASAATWMGDGDTPPLHPFSGGEWDITSLSLSEDGEYRWHTFYGSSEGQSWEEAGHGVTATGDGLVIIVGHSSLTWDGDYGTSPVTPFHGAVDTFLLVLDSTGAYQQHRFYGQPAGAVYPNNEPNRDICTDNQGSAISTGSAPTNWLGDGEALPLNPHSEGNNYDIEVIKLARLNRIFLPAVTR